MKQYSVRTRAGLDFPNDLNPIVQHLLFHRNIREESQVKRFLNPDYQLDQHDPHLLKDIEKVVDRIFLAIENKEKIVVYTDYDTDGIPGGVIWNDFFKKIEYKNYDIYIPHRHDEGFGLNINAIKNFIKEKVNLLITVDCGITDIDPVKLAMKNKIDVIITDHHTPPKNPPKAFAIINPKQQDCKYPEKMLCGSGVTFKIIQALVNKIREEKKFEIGEGWEKWLLDMVGIATLSDMVPLVGENRTFAYFGLKVLKKSKRPGLKLLLKDAGVKMENIVEDDIGFSLGPRINAASRMGVPRDAFLVLSAETINEALPYVDHLKKINNERKGLVASMVKEAKKRILERENLGGIVVIGNPDWKPGLLGLVANSLAQDFMKPFFVWGRDGDGIIKGSCRSDGFTNLVHIMDSVPKDTFLQYGGHAFSGGFSVSGKNIHNLEEVINQSFKINLQDQKQEFIDVEINLDDIGENLYREIEKLSPFGTGNEKPLFIVKNIIPYEIKIFGKEKHHTELKFKNSKGKSISAIAFFVRPEDFGLTEKKSINIVGHIEKSFFMYRPEVRFRIIDII